MDTNFSNTQVEVTGPFVLNLSGCRKFAHALYMTTPVLVPGLYHWVFGVN